MSISVWPLAFLVMISGSTRVWANEAPFQRYSGAAGFQLLEKVGSVVRQESRGIAVRMVPAMQMGTESRSLLEAELNRHLNLWFDYVALMPTPEMVSRVVDEIYFVLIRATGSSILQTAATSEHIKSVIQSFVKPLRERHPETCSTLLFQRIDRPATVH